MKNKVKGFTLVELLAVIVILAVILVIAVPQIMSTINDATKGTFESNAKLIAKTAENRALELQTLGITENIKCEDIVKLNDTDYESCSIKIENGEVKVTIVGAGKFKGMNICGGTKTNAVVTEDACSTDAACFAYEEIKTNEAKIPYEVADYDNCVSYLGFDEYDAPICKNEKGLLKTFEDMVGLLIDEGYTVEELINNKVIRVERNESGDIISATAGEFDSCVNYVDDTFINALTQEDVHSFCRGEDLYITFPKYISMGIKMGMGTEQELIDNNVIKTIVSEVTITGYDVPCGKDVIVPETINGANVTRIGDYAFTVFGVEVNKLSNITNNNTTNLLVNRYEIYNVKPIAGSAPGLGITSVTLPNTIKSIGDKAFHNNQITEIDFSNLSNLSEIGSSAFYGNPLSYVHLENTSASIGDCAFGFIDGIKEHNIPATYRCELK